MRVQEAAYRLLIEEGRPLASRELARLALDGGMVGSNSGDPVLSISSTIEKNIREGTYNRPELVFVQTSSGRQVALPNWRPEGLNHLPAPRKLAVQIPADLADQVKLACLAGLAPSFEETVARLIKLGLSSATPQIRASMLRQLEALGRQTD